MTTRRTNRWAGKIQRERRKSGDIIFLFLRGVDV
jgi:hypothetical protein